MMRAPRAAIARGSLSEVQKHYSTAIKTDHPLGKRELPLHITIQN
jgi:hypothetical protein